MSQPMTESDPPETYETFVRLFVKHEGRLRGFIRSLLSDWDAVDEVMQETSLVAWRKFHQFDPESNFLAWGASIARFEALKYMRKQSRDRLVFNDELIELIATETLEDSNNLENLRNALTSCLAKLPEKQKQLLHMAYQPGVKFHEIATQTGKSTEAFYKIIQRLRAQLQTCAERHLRQQI